MRYFTGQLISNVQGFAITITVDTDTSLLHQQDVHFLESLVKPMQFIFCFENIIYTLLTIHAS